MGGFYTLRERIALFLLRHAARRLCRMFGWRWLPRGFRDRAYDMGWSLLMRGHRIHNRATARAVDGWQGGA